MGKKSIFGLDPEKLDKLLSIGTDDVNVSEAENATSPQKSDDPSPAASLDAFVEQPGTCIGRYKLLNMLGEGGMGIVYLAQQELPIRRQVALKVIKPGMDSARVIARFEAERQALALLDHPNIAHVHDAGTTENSRPYFVMEYVEGLSITEHCDHYKLTIEDRLNLFLQVCHAVHHAHLKGIIHRDIKPSNILVSIREDQGVPKIIDFGIAKAISRPLSEGTLFTEQGQLFGTPEYMSPEQAEMGNLDIDIRTDVYSLGVLLYVLLTGVLPFDPKILREGGIDTIRQVIREEDPKTPCTRLTSLGEEATKVAESRSTEVATLARCLHKELEWIPLKAMRKERTERYRSVSELADDVENYLKGAPLIAGPPSTVYRLKKFMGRNRALVTGIVAVLAVLMAGVVVSAVFAIGQARARAETERQAMDAQAVNNFLSNDLVWIISPFRAWSRDATIRSFLDAVSENLEDKFEDRPLIEASIRHVLGSTYQTLTEYKEADPHLQRALDIRRERLGAEHPLTLDTMTNIAWLYWQQSRYDEAELLAFNALQGRRHVLGDEHTNTLMSMIVLGAVYWFQGHYDKTEPLFFGAMEVSRRVLGQEHRWTVVSMSHLGTLYTSQGRYDKAEPLLLEAVKSMPRVWGPEHPYTTVTMRRLGFLYLVQGRYDEAEPLLVEAEKVDRRVLGEEHTYTMASMNSLGSLYVRQERYDEAEPLLCKALDAGSQVLGEEHLYLLWFRNALAGLYTKQERYDEAEPLLVKAVDIGCRTLGEKHPETLGSINGLGVLRTKQKRYDEAEPLLIQALEGRRLRLGDEHPHTQGSLNDLIELYKAWNKPEKADQWRAKLPQTEATIE